MVLDLNAINLIPPKIIRVTFLKFVTHNYSIELFSVKTKFQFNRIETLFILFLLQLENLYI